MGTVKLFFVFFRDSFLECSQFNILSSSDVISAQLSVTEDSEQ